MIEIKIKRAGAQFKIMRVEKNKIVRIEDIKAKCYIATLLCNKCDSIYQERQKKMENCWVWKRSIDLNFEYIH